VSKEDLTGFGRPDSPSSFLDGKSKKESWLKRLSSRNRTSVIYENKPEVKVAMGPPPPKLPELNQLKHKVADNDEGSLGGGDMFSNIRGE